MSPQTQTKASVGFKAGVKDYKLNYYTDILAAFRVTPQPGVPPEEAGAAVAETIIFFFKINTMIMSIIPTKKTILIHNFIFMKKRWYNSRNLTKNDQIALFSSKIETKLRLKNIKRPTSYFWKKIKTKRLIPIFYIN